MTGTSRALRRLGVTGLGAAIISVGLVPLTEIAANAAVVYPTTTATSVSLSPDTDTAAANACNPFTITVGGPANRSVSVNIQQSVPAATAGTAAGAVVIGFCQPLAANPDSGPVTPVLAGPGTPGATTTAASPNPSSCTNTALAANTAGNVSCNTSYTDTNNDGSIVIGVTSNTAGSMSVNAFGDANANGAQDSGEPGDTSIKTWVANSQTATTDKITCTPATATNPTNSTHNFTCTVTDAAGNGLAGVTNVNYIVTSGPDATAVPTSCPTTANGTAGTTAGNTQCALVNNGQPGHDVIVVYLEQNSIVGQQSGEPSTTITKDWVQSASSGSTLSISCSPHQTATTPAAGTPPTGATANCQEDVATKSVTITATATNGSPATPQAGVVITFDNPPTQVGGAADAGDTESVSPTTCVTNSSGTCTATFTDTSPVDGEVFNVVAHLTRQGQASATATATITYHTATSNEARNVTLAPKTATQPQGGSQDFLATVTDRFGNPVPNTCLGFNETGAGHFANTNTFACGVPPFGGAAGTYDTQCVTSATGQCKVTVVSQTTESGIETVSVTIDANNYFSATTVECTAPADRTYATGGNSTTTPPGNASVGAKAGNCTDSGVVTWKSSTPPPTTKRVVVNLKLACFSHHKHKVTCVGQLSKAISGVTVIFYNGHGNKIGSDVTGSAGKAKLHIRGLRSGSHHKYQAHAKRSSRTFAADSKIARVTVK